MQRTAAAVAEQREIARIVAARDRDLLDNRRHSQIGDRQNAFGGADGGVGTVVAERFGDPRNHRLARERGVELHFAAEEILGVQPAEQEVGIGHRRLRAAAGIPCGTRHRAGATRADTETALAIEPSDRAAADADFENIDDVAADRKSVVGAADVVDRFHGIAAALDQRAFCRRAAHVEGDEIVDAEKLAVARSADAAADRTGLHKRDRLAATAFRRDHAAMRSHQQKRSGEAALAQASIKLGDVFADLRADIGIGRDRRRALELVPFARELGAGGDEHVRQKAAQCRSGLFFVIRGQVGIEETDRERLDLERAQGVRKRLQFIFHQRRADAAGAFDALLDLEPQLAGISGGSRWKRRLNGWVRLPRPISRMSRKPWVVINAVLAPARCNSALMTSVVPCLTKLASRASSRALRMHSKIASPSRP